MQLLVISVVLIVGTARLANMFEMQCGFADVENLIAATAIPSCPKAYMSVNECCIEHDDCYDAKNGRTACDSRFCGCLFAAAERERWFSPSKVWCNMLAAQWCTYVHTLGWTRYSGRRRAALLPKLLNVTETH